MSGKIKAIIFDMDGVILNSEPIYLKVQCQIFSSLGFTVPEAEYNTFIGAGMRTMWQKLKTSRNLSQSVNELIDYNNKILLEYIRNCINLETIPFFRNFLELVFAGKYKTAVASSTAKAIIFEILKKLRIDEYFSIIVSGEEVEAGKPAPDIFLETARRLEVEPADCLVIEDSFNGVEAAKTAGMKCVGFSNPSSGNQDLSRADLIITSFSDLNISDLEKI